MESLFETRKGLDLVAKRSSEPPRFLLEFLRCKNNRVDFVEPVSGLVIRTELSQPSGRRCSGGCCPVSEIELRLNGRSKAIGCGPARSGWDIFSDGNRCSNVCGCCAERPEINQCRLSKLDQICPLLFVRPEG